MKSTNNPVAIVLLLTVALATAEIQNKGWWEHTVFYQIYPRSLMDSNGDGVGDLKGIQSKIEHLHDLGVGAVWLSPIFKSPMVDFGYDIEDFVAVDPIFGTAADLNELVNELHKLGVKLVLDLVPNHTSDKHKWFQLSVNRTGKYADYFVWSDGKKDANGNRQPPNNWVTFFNGSAWTFNEQRQQYYLHQYYPQQPDLNYRNPDVQQELLDVLKFWLDRGVDGFRIDSALNIFENNMTQDEPPLDPSNFDPNNYAAFNHIFTRDQPQTYEIIESWREYVDKYADERNQSQKVILTEAYTSWEGTIKYYDYGVVPFNFKLITEVDAYSSAGDFKNVIDKWMQMMPKGKVPNWVLGNHDRVRVHTRFPGRGDQLVMLDMVLPGVAVTYYGEEIGMVDNTTLHIYNFRDSSRTPFQWDNSKNAGFSTSDETWLPVNSNYKHLNLKNEKAASKSHYKLYKALVNMRKSDVLTNGDLKTAVLKNDVLAILRNTSREAVAFLMNFSDKKVTVDLSGLVPYKKVTVSLSSLDSKVAPNISFKTSKVTVPAKASLLLHASRVSKV